MSIARHIPRLTAMTLSVLLASRLASAQGAGTISGTIVDESQRAVPGAAVTLVNEQTTDARTTSSDTAGAFQFQLMPPGVYTVRVELQGFRTFERRGNVLNASSMLTLGHLPLAVGALTEVVTVQATGTKVETTNSDHSALLTSTQISQIQTRGRDVTALLRLLPGVRYEDNVEAMGEDFGTLIPQIGGQRRQWNTVSVDGLLGNEASGSNRMSSAINLDAIEEVKVLLNTYKAEYGRSGGANIQIITKSGGADYRGTGYYYGRRDGWNATRWENNRAGVAKPEYHFDTYGFNLGGPVAVPGLWRQNDKKLFFFYSVEAPQGQRPPGPIRQYRLPTELERRGDFSQTRDQQGRLVFIRDPLSTGACNILTGGPGCFPGNVVPQDRIDRNGLALLNVFPLPNRTDLGSTGQNFLRQETSDHPRLNNLARIDWKRSANATWFGTLRTFSSKQTGSEITAGPPDWGFYDGTYEFGDNSVTLGWTRVLGDNKVNELSGGFGRRSEGFGVGADGDWTRLRKSDVGYALGQFNPGLNPAGLIPRANFGGLPTTGGDGVDMNYPDRIGATALDYVASVRDTFSWVRGRHAFKFGGYLEYMENNEARGGNWSGQFTFNRDTANPLDTNYTYANALLGVFSSYTETDRPGSSFNRGVLSEWFAQDTWRPSDRLTIDYGVRFLWYSPWWRPDGIASNFRPELYDPTRAPALYRPVVVNGVARAQNPLTGELVAPVFVGAFVPGTGDPENGMELANDPGVPRGFRAAIAPQIEPRLGFAYDLRGDGSTVLRASAGLYHNARLGGGSLGNLRNPPFYNNPTLYYGTMGTMLQAGSSLANRPVNVNALERDAKTPSAISASIGVARDVGWGTVVDAAYVGSFGRHLEMEWNINAVPDEARFLDRHPENRDPRTNAALPAEFLRPYVGYQDIFVRGNFGTSNYHALQLQVNRRYIRGVQFGLAYTWGRAFGIGDDDPARVSFSRPTNWYYAVAEQNQDHSLVINYTWDVPDGSRLWNNVVMRGLLDGWQLSGENAFVSGEWAGVTMSTTDGFDFSGGDGGTGSGLGGANGLGAGFTNDGLRVVRPRVVGVATLPRGERDPLTGWFNTAAFARPTGRGDYGDAARTLLERPGVNNWNVSLFKNFGLGGVRKLQFRVEAYNVLNHTQFRELNRNAQFDPNGNQVNTNFGTVLGVTSPTRNARIVQLSLRVNF
jgi:Carboxypeptidase regulatory-like domain/TonB-dependent Receptor Plug Domain